MIGREFVSTIHITVHRIAYTRLSTLKKWKIDYFVKTNQKTDLHWSRVKIAIFLWSVRGLTFGRVSMYDSGISISARIVLLIAIAALWIWFANSRLFFSCFRAFSDRPHEGMQGTGNHHFSSFCNESRRNEADFEWFEFEFDDMLPFSAYQNSVSWKLSKMSCQNPNKIDKSLSKCLTKVLLQSSYSILPRASCQAFPMLEGLGIYLTFVGCSKPEKTHH